MLSSPSPVGKGRLSDIGGGGTPRQRKKPSRHYIMLNETGDSVCSRTTATATSPRLIRPTTITQEDTYDYTAADPDESIHEQAAMEQSNPTHQLFSQAAAYLQESNNTPFFRWVIRWYADRKLRILFFVHMVCTLVVWRKSSCFVKLLVAFSLAHATSLP